jgi:hypothetical protein
LSLLMGTSLVVGIGIRLLLHRARLDSDLRWALRQVQETVRGNTSSAVRILTRFLNL